MRGAFVVFEGGDGAGKSTQVRLLAAALAAHGLRVVTTREPGGTAVGEAVREVLLGAGSEGMDPRTEALLFAAARAQHAATLIRPEVAAGAVVISDRFVDSSVAYQGAARGLGEATIIELNRWATHGLQPDLTVLLDVSPEVGLARAADANRMEAEPEAFHEAVRACLLRSASTAPDSYLVIPAGQPVERIAEQVLARVLTLLPAWDGPGPGAPSDPNRPEAGRLTGSGLGPLT